MACAALHILIQVLIIGQSQGGHVAAKLAGMTTPDALVLLASLPDDPEADTLRALAVPVVIGWKVSLDVDNLRI